MKSFFIWYLTILFIGTMYLPFSMLLFRGWNDRGWIFSKSLGVLCGGYVMWVLNTAHILKFTAAASALSLLVPAAAAVAVPILRNQKVRLYVRIPLGRILAEEAGFFLLLALAVYVIGFKPEIYGTEKFMDYGFITSALRSDYMPFADPWFSGKPVNYYYGGQYLTACLIRLSHVTAGEGYTYMRALITALSFMLPFSLVSQMMRDRLCAWDGAQWMMRDRLSAGNGRRTPSSSPADILSGLLAGLAAAFCGNGHYIVYRLVLPAWCRIRGTKPEYTYWFPDSTRFIGYFPENNDRTIHEFPAYSSILGDLHAHYINIIFVVLVTAAAYAWARRVLAEKQAGGTAGLEAAAGSTGLEAAAGSAALKPAFRFLKAVFAPEILFIGAVTGLFRWTNFWDFPIYYVVCGSVIFFVNLMLYREDIKTFFFVMPCQAVLMFLTGKAAAYPFTAKFDQISSEILRTYSHSPLWQLLVLWGLPATISICFITARVIEVITKKRQHSTGILQGLALSDLRALPPSLCAALPDLCAALFAMCAMGLVWLPEVIFVKDIYTETHHRANTMFKLTYQAFILFAIVMSYVLVRALALRTSGKNEGAASSSRSKKWMQRAASAAPLAGIFLLLFTGGFMINGVTAWFGDSLTPDNRIGSDASVFVEENFPDDFEAISWLNNSVEGQPVILEADGDSYTDYGRVSVATGLPTVLGWYVHEWLWRNDTAAENERVQDIRAIYTGTDKEEVLSLIRKYNIRYIYIGTLERSKFPELNDLLLRELGKLMYSDGTNTCILEIPGGDSGLTN